MARLPTPGGDENTWGTVLNEFLSQSLNSDGTIKPAAAQAAVPDATATTKGVVKLTNDFGGTADLPQVTGLRGRAVSTATPANNNVLAYNSTSSQWEPQAAAGAPDATTSSKGVVQLAGDLSGTATSPTVPGLAARQPLDSDLTAIAGLGPANDDIIQRKSGAWTNRTPAQVKTDLALTSSDVGLGNVPNVDATTRANHTGTQLASTISDFDTQVRTNRLDQMAAPTAAVSLNSQRITNVADPTSAQDAATKAYVDATAQGLDIKQSVRLATTANITLSGTQTIDGVSAQVGDRVLVKDQSTGSQNGLYVVAGGAWTRATDADTSAEVTAGLFTFVAEGTVNGNYGFVLTTDDPIVLDTTTLTFTQFSGAGQVTAGAGLTKTANSLDVGQGTGITINADNVAVDFAAVQAKDATLDVLATYNTNGILTQTAADTFTGRTITGTSNRINVTNGNGVSGNPTLDIGTDVTTLTGSQTLTNKTITDSSNNVTASGLRSATTTVGVSAATAPTANQILRATSGTAATWQDLSAANVTFSNGTSALAATTTQGAIDETVGLLMAQGTLAARPTPGAAGNRALYYATDDNGGTLYRSNGSSWQQIGASINQTGGMQLGSAALSANYTNQGQGAETQMTGMSVTVTVGSRPIAISISGALEVAGTGADTDNAGPIMKRDATTVNGFTVPPVARTAGATKLFSCSWYQIDTPSAGSHTYTLHFGAGTAAKYWTAFAAVAGFFPPFRMSIVEL